MSDIAPAINWPHPMLHEEWQRGGYMDGATEPWVQQVVAALLVASGQRTVLELGCYKGFTAVWLCDALQRLGGGTYVGVDIEAERQALTLDRLGQLHLPDVQYTVVQADALAVLHQTAPHSVGFCWVDDDHTPQHVAEELDTLLSPTMPAEAKMVSGGLVVMHDVHGGEGRMTPLHGVCTAAHGFALDLPRIGLLGGLGLIQAS